MNNLSPNNKLIIFLVSIATISYSFLSTPIKNSSLNKRDQDHDSKRLETNEGRDEYLFMLTRDPTLNVIPKNMREKELKHAEKIPIAGVQLLKSGKSNSISWREIGPFDVGGRTRAFAIDLDNSNTLLAGGVSGGIWKSYDKGLSWYMKSSKKDILSITSIAQDPRKGKRNEWYAVSGEYIGNSASARNLGNSFLGGGVYKSTDNGENWSPVKTNIINPDGTSANDVLTFASKVVISPVTGTVFIASHLGGILKSTDGGVTWSPGNKIFCLGNTNGHAYTDISVNDNGMLIATLSEFRPYPLQNPQIYSPGIYLSVNDGESWSNITPSTFPATSERSIIAIAPSSQNIIYVFTNSGKSDQNGEILNLFRINIMTNETIDLSDKIADRGIKDGLKTQRNYNMAIAIHPTNEKIVLIAGISLARSFDGFLTTPSFFGTSYTWSHSDKHLIVFNKANPNEVWVAHDGGLSYSNDITKSSIIWEDRDKGFAVTQFYTIAMSAINDDNRVAGGTQDNGTPLFKMNYNNISNNITGGDGAYCYFGSSFFYGSSQYGDLYRYRYDANGEISKTGSLYIKPHNANNSSFINPFLINPNNEKCMFFLDGKIFWKNIHIDESIEQLKNSWVPVDLNLPAGYKFSTLSISRDNPSGILYLGASNYNNQPKIYRINNITISETAIDITPKYPSSGAGTVPNGTYISSIAVNPKNSNEILVTFSNYNVQSLWHSNDGGLTYTNIEGNLGGADGPSIRSSTILSVNNGYIYFVGTSTGVYSTTELNGSNTVWSLEGADVIGNVVVESITSREADGTVLIGSHGRGAFIGKYLINDIKEKPEIPNLYDLKQNYPNPFNPRTTIRFSISKMSNVCLKVYNISGAEVATLVNQNLQAGTHSVDFSGVNLSSGIYYYQIRSGSYSKTLKMVLLK